MERIKLPFNGLKIAPNDLVLEVGSGHSPCYRSDVLCDRFWHDGERGGKLVVDRPIFLGDCGALPFQDKAFDYVIASHVLEHTDDPEQALKELSRVSQKGYIETPSLFWEKLHPTRKYHRWFILLIEDTLVLVRKNNRELNAIFGELFEIISRNSLEYHLFLRAYRKLFTVSYEWKERINYQVEPKDNYWRSFFEEPWERQNYIIFDKERSFAQQIVGLGVNLFSSIMEIILRYPLKLIGTILRVQRNKKLSIDFEKILACPKCHGTVRIFPDQIHCMKCKAIYLYKNGIPDMVAG